MYICVISWKLKGRLMEKPARLTEDAESHRGELGRARVTFKPPVTDFFKAHTAPAPFKFGSANSSLYAYCSSC